MSVYINVLLISSGTRVLLPGVTMALALPATTSIKDMNLDGGTTVGVFSSYAESLGCLAEVIDLTMLPNGLPGIVVRGTERMRVLSTRRTEGDLRYGAIENCLRSPVSSALRTVGSLHLSMP